MDGAEPELITGGVGFITSYTFINQRKVNQPIELGKARLELVDFNEGDWITQIIMDKKRRILFACCDSAISV